MKRSLVKLVLLLVLGAIVNVAVAWGLAYLSTIDWRLSDGQTKCDHFSNWFDRPEFAGYTASRWVRSGATRVTVAYMRDFSGMPARTTCQFEEIIPEWALAFLDMPELSGREHHWPLDEIETHVSIVDARGWPCLSLWGGLKVPTGAKISINGQAVVLVRRQHWIIPLSTDTNQFATTDYRWLPLRPIWPGFAINTVFYAVVLWLLFAAPFALRRRRRTRRGLCPKCAYDLRGTPKDASACPECGGPIRV